jgi:flagellar assembly protein FliH
LSNKIFKNYQINLGLPFQVKVPLDELFEGAFFDGGGEGAVFEVDGGVGSLYRADGFFGADGFSGAGVSGDEADADTSIDADGADADAVLAAARIEAQGQLAAARAESAEILTAAGRDAIGIVDAAKEEARGLIEQARQNSETERQAALEQARQQGYQQGYEEGKAAYDGLVAEAESLRDEAAAEYKQLLSGAEADAVELVLAIAKKVVGEEMVMNRQNLLVLIKDAFSHCSNKEQVVLKISSDDYDYIRANKDVLLSMVEGVGRLELKRDLSLRPGACFVETPFGSIDAGVATRLSKVEDAFYRLLAGDRKERLLAEGA